MVFKQNFEQPSEMVRIAICAQLTNICFYLWFDLDSWIFFKILILTRLAVLEGKAHMQLNLTFFPLPNLTEVILDQDIECRGRENDHDPNIINAGWVNCQSQRENNVISGIPTVGSRIRCRKNISDGGTLVSHCFSIKGN